MTYNKKQQAEKAEQQERIEYFRRFFLIVQTCILVGFIPVIKWQERLNDTGHPEETYQACYEKEHFPRTYFGTCQMAFCENNADDEKNGKPHQLEKLQP